MRPPLQPIHTDDIYLVPGKAKSSYGFWSQHTTDQIVESLRPGEREALRFKPDGRIYNGNTRIKILRERGFDAETLPREVIP